MAITAYLELIFTETENAHYGVVVLFGHCKVRHCDIDMIYSYDFRHLLDSFEVN